MGAYRFGGHGCAVDETVALLAARAPRLRKPVRDAKKAGCAYVVMDGTLIPIDRVAADRPFYSGKHKRHGMNLQVIASPTGHILWVSGVLPGSVHDKKAEWVWGVLDELEAAGLRGSGWSAPAISRAAHSHDKSEPLASRGATSVADVYTFDPVPHGLSEGARKNIGAQAQRWTEYIPDTDKAGYMYFPRLCAFAEVVRSPPGGELAEFEERLTRHLPRLDACSPNTPLLDEDGRGVS
jgi:hypothetical protein